MTNADESRYDIERRKRIVEGWEKPLAMPRPVPKPGGGKKKKVRQVVEPEE